MFKAGMLRALVLRISLVALAVQGMTPDLRDVSSLNLTRILPTIAARSIVAVGGAATAPTGVPTPDRSDDGMPDEVCPVPSAASYTPCQADPKGRPSAGASVGGCDAPPPRPSRLRPPAPAGAGGCRAGLIHALCRLTC
jgi:hypothetical protein